MRTAVEYHAILDRAPTVKEFNTACSSLGLDWDHNRVRRVWGRYRNLQQALLGGRVVPTDAVRRGTRRRKGTLGEGDPLRGLRLFLATETANG